MSGDTQTEPDSPEWTTVTVKPATRDKLRSLKRGGESYSDLFERMIRQYEPPADVQNDD